MINALSVDVEFWHSPYFISDYLPDKVEDQIDKAIVPILDLLDNYEVKATFFVLGEVAEKYPSIIKMIYDKGHEIASHCYSHKTLYELGREGFEDELKKSVDLLNSITGKRPIGFRAPTFSIDNSTKWAFEILKKYNFKYDSSIFPIKTMVYGVPNAPLIPYRPLMEDITKNDPRGEIVEFPLTVFRFLRNIPVAGGFYLRALPFWFTKFAIERINQKRPAIIYIHPWETFMETPQLSIPFYNKFITYAGIKTSFKKFEKLLRGFDFKPVSAVLKERDLL